MYAAIDEMRLARDALFAELRRVREEGQETRQEVTELSDLVAELEEIIPISPRQAEYIQRSIKRIAARVQVQRTGRKSDTTSSDNVYALLYGQLKAEIGAQRYDAIPRKYYPAALAWLERKAKELLPGDDDALPPHQEQLL
jgi:hypothetical protein